jgi:homopolymeric O-antigen transport system ATP-binding protein
MAYVTLGHVGVDFTIYQNAARSWRRTLFRATVGGVTGASQENGRVTVRALQDINLDLRSGARLALLGHNGAGKTTLLRTLAGIYHPTAGEVKTSGLSVPLFDIGLGFDEDASGYENILLRGLLMGSRRAEIERRTEEIAKFSGLGDFLNLPVRTYSSGMAMRLMFSIATSIEADILLMDEWIATGDQEFIGKATERLNELIDRAHILVFASHSMGILRQLCNRAIVLQAGRIVFDGSVDEAIAHHERQQSE